MNWSDAVVHYAISDVGVRRSHNQDAFTISLASTKPVFDKRGHLFVVADGMGAHAVGEMASKLAVDSIAHVYTKLTDDAPSALVKAITEANKTIHEKGRQNSEFKGMGTTATALALLGRGAYVGHVGDSRCYRIRSTHIDQLSFDHSLQWEHARRLKVRPEDVTGIPSNIIIRSLGPEPNVKVDLNGPYPVELGDNFLLCSDGLSGLVSDWEIWAALRHLPVDEAAQFLVNLANLRGGTDNITVIIASVPGEKPKKGVTGALTGLLKPVSGRLSWVTWPIWFLILSLFLSAGANALFMVNSNKYGLAVGLSFLSCLIGVSSLLWKQWRTARRTVNTPPSAAPLFRSRECMLDRETVEDMTDVQASLSNLAEAEQWQIDFDQLKLRGEAARNALEKNELEVAFRELCRSISILAIGLPQRRAKSEVLMPNWETRRKAL